MKPTFVFIALCAFAVILLVRSSGSGRVQRDPRRNFTQAQRSEGFSRAKNQCEHINVFGRRCTAAPAHGDHHYPHSKGGATTLANFVALCARHNLTKGSRVPSSFATRRLEKRRASYFPPGARVDIVWRLGQPQGR